MKRRVTRASASGLGIFIVLCCVAIAGIYLLRGTNDDEEGKSEATQTQSGDEAAQSLPTNEAAPDDRTTQTPTQQSTSNEIITTPVCDCSGNLLDCADFSSPQDAQECYTFCLSTVDADVHLLDGDQNGVVCESVWPGWATPAVSATPTKLAPTAAPQLTSAAPTSAPQPTEAVPTPALQPTSAAVCVCSYNAYNCSNFGSHAAAQRCYNYCRSIGMGDVHDLDRDSDGSACESLP